MSHKILVVDDEPVSLKLTETILTRNGFEVQTALSGKQGLEKLKGYTPQPACCRGEKY